MILQTVSLAAIWQGGGGRGMFEGEEEVGEGGHTIVNANFIVITLDVHNL